MSSKDTPTTIQGSGVKLVIDYTTMSAEIAMRLTNKFIELINEYHTEIFKPEEAKDVS